METADEVLRCFEDDNEFHFHDIDRVWIIEAMEEYAKQVSEKCVENNNGWIRIVSEDDLPKKSGLYYILNEEDSIVHSEFDVDFGQFFTKDFAYDYYEITHYQPISKPKPPIY